MVHFFCFFFLDFLTNISATSRTAEWDGGNIFSLENFHPHSTLVVREAIVIIIVFCRSLQSQIFYEICFRNNVGEIYGKNLPSQKIFIFLRILRLKYVYSFFGYEAYIKK
jgi:hypothetical protein